MTPGAAASQVSIACRSGWKDGGPVWKPETDTISVQVGVALCLLNHIEAQNALLEQREGKGVRGLLAAVERYLCGLSSRDELRKAWKVACKAMTPTP